MLLDYHFSTCSRQCAATGRTLAPGESYYATLTMSDGAMQRLDYGFDAWKGPPEGHVGWWKSSVPTSDQSQPKLAPSDVLLNLFLELNDRPDETEFRYLLGLILIRKKVLRLEETVRDGEGREVLVLDCPRRNEKYELLAAEPTADRTDELQRRVETLLYNDGE